MLLFLKLGALKVRGIVGGNGLVRCEVVKKKELYMTLLLLDGHRKQEIERQEATPTLPLWNCITSDTQSTHHCKASVAASLQGMLGRSSLVTPA